MHGSIYPCFLKVLDSKKVNCSDGNGNTLLHLAVQALQPRLCKTLIICGANVGAINMQGYSPLFALFSHFDHKINDDNIDKIRAISDILIDSGADINSKTRSGMAVFKIASQCNSERLMLCLLRKHPDLKLVTGSDFKLAFTNAWFDYAKALIDRIPENYIKTLITTEIFPLAMTRSNQEILTSMFMKASGGVQQSVIEDLLRHFSDHGEYDAFLNLMETKIFEPKLFSDGETLLTNLLKKKNEKYCWPVIAHVAYKKYLNMANLSRQIPLQIAIEADLYDLVCQLIFECDQLNNEDNEGNTPLMQLFKKLSTISDISINNKLMTAVKAGISRGADIYKETTAGKKVIEFCSQLSLRAKIEDFEKDGKNRGCQVTEEPGAKKVFQKPHFRELEFTENGMESFKAGLNNIFSDAIQLSRLKEWFLKRGEIPKGNLSRCQSFDKLFYEISKKEKFDSLIEFVKNGDYEKDDEKIKDVMNCWGNVKGPCSECPKCKRSLL